MVAQDPEELSQAAQPEIQGTCAALAATLFTALSHSSKSLANMVCRCDEYRFSRITTCTAAFPVSAKVEAEETQDVQLQAGAYNKFVEQKKLRGSWKVQVQSIHI
jgi:hypothetical protein